MQRVPRCMSARIACMRQYAVSAHIGPCEVNHLELARQALDLRLRRRTVRRRARRLVLKIEMENK